jgi:hypothetical protein
MFLLMWMSLVSALEHFLSGHELMLEPVSQQRNA